MAFHIHVPKPLHGWKAFFNEISVIVIGVLIALALEAIVEWAHWQHKAEDGKERLKVELQQLAFYAAEQIATAPCVQTQLSGLESHLLASKGTMEPVPLVQNGFISTPVWTPLRPWPAQTWEALQQDGTTGHMSPQLQWSLGRIYQLTSLMRRRNDQTEDAQARLRLASQPVELTPEIRASLLQDIWSQSNRSESGAENSSQNIARIRYAGLAPSDEEIDAKLAARNYLSDSYVQLCKQISLPIGDWKAVVAKVRLPGFRQ